MEIFSLASTFLAVTFEKKKQFSSRLLKHALVYVNCLRDLCYTSSRRRESVITGNRRVN